MSAVQYECVKCGRIDSGEEWNRTGAEQGAWKCPFCGYKVGKKVRPPIVKRVKAQ